MVFCGFSIRGVVIKQNKVDTLPSLQRRWGVGGRTSEVHYLGIRATYSPVLFKVVSPRDHLPPEKKNVLFRHCPNYLSLPPNLGNLYNFFFNLGFRFIVILLFGQGPSPHLPISGHAGRNTFFIREIFPKATEWINSIDGSRIIFIC